MTLTPAFLDELRARTSLSALIGRTVKLQRAGREHRGCCPFHNEKTPSFYVNDDKGFYHCFGCSAHGDAIRWMTDQRGLPFIDAVKELAQAAGLDVPAPDPRAAERQEKQKGLHEALQAAADWFAAQLDGLDGAEARALLKRRGVSDETRRAFGFGFAPDARGRLRAALKDFGDPMLIEAGLLIQVEGKEPYDRFRGRLTIPIRDPRGRVIAFGGRVIGEGEPKYLNSPDTPLFDKGRTLFNLDRAAPASRTTARVVVVEGYMDVVALAQAGIGEAVAPLGTAVTEAQLERLWRLADVPVLCLDGDAAGQKAALRAARRALPLLTPGKSLRFVRLPTGQDPDDVVREGGADQLRRLLKKTSTLDEQLWAAELGNAEISTPDGRALFKKRLEAIAAEIKDDDVRYQYSRALLSRFFDLFGLRSKRGGADRLRQLHDAVAEANRHRGRSVDYHLRRAVLLGLMRHPSVIASYYEEVSMLKLTDRYLRKWRDHLLNIANTHDILTESLVDEILATTDVAPIDKRDYQRDLAFSFYRLSSEASVACNDLKKVIDLMLEEEEARDAVVRAQANFKKDMSEANFAAQIHALRMEAELFQSLSDWREMAEAAATAEREQV